MAPRTVNVINVSARRRILTFWERIYLPEIVRGLWLTARHFWVNLWRHALRAVGIKTSLPGAATFQYPEVRRPQAPRLRTLHRLVQRPDGSPRCVACMMCETVCPAFCIKIVAAEVVDPNIEKRPHSFDIDLGRCVFCGYCVEACPEDAIRMDTGIVEIGSMSRGGMILDMPTLLSLKSADEQAGKPVDFLQRRFVS
ncbi:MAG: NADH-quinone oxidoreductase subunit I [candidate division Zixibacteria bacterium]|nr:NADH-quinone oxidoreductase subunit I [candidate division Zixibacteria bacterium]